jgi:hypothetical protein
MHGCKHLTSIINFAANIFGPIVPIKSQGIDGLRGIVVHVKKFHNSTEIIRLSRRLANQIYMI